MDVKLAGDWGQWKAFTSWSDEELAVVARYYSQRMGKLDFFAHESRSVTVRFHTGAPGFESSVSAQK